jgi:hypothetical protein
MATLTIPFPNFQNGQPIVAAQHNSNNTAIANFSNGLSAGQNFDNGAIGTASIAGQAITTALIADANVTSIKLAASLTLTTPVLGVASATSITVGTVAGLSVPTNGVLVQGNVVYHIATNPQTTAYTLALADDGKLIEILSATAVNVTIPLESSVAFPIGTQITVLQTGTGQLTFVPAVGVTINANPGSKTRGQWTAATLIKRDANIWVALGDLSS